MMKTRKSSRRKVGRPRKVVAAIGVDPNSIDPRRILAAIASDPAAPCTARVSAARALLLAVPAANDDANDELNARATAWREEQNG
jgi:hypothetical protein